MNARCTPPARTICAAIALAACALATTPLTASAYGDGHRLLIADIGNHRMSQVPWTPGSASTSFDPTNSQVIGQPNGFAVGPDCRVYAASYTSDEIIVFTGEGVVSEIIPLPSGAVQPCDVVFQPTTGLMYVSLINQQAVLTYDIRLGTWTGAPITSVQMATTLTPGGRPGYMTFLPNRHLLIADYQDGEILDWDPSTATLTTLISGLLGPENLALGPNGDLFVVEYQYDRIVRFSSASNFSTSVVFAGFGVDSLSAPHGLAFGPDGHLYTCDRNVQTIVEYGVPAAANGIGSLVGVFASNQNALALAFESRACFGPLERGEIVSTYLPDTDCGCVGGFCTCNGPKPWEAVVRIVDPDVVPYPALGENTLAPMFTNSTPLTASSWTYGNLGPVMGIAIDRASSPNIYVASTAAFGTFWPGTVPLTSYNGLYKLDGVTHNWSLLDTLPNTGCGLGDLAWNPYAKRLYVSNFEDGCIYAYTSTGTQTQKFDPFNLADPDNDGPIPIASGGRVWGLCVVDKKTLYFSAWLRDSAAIATPWPSIWPPLPSGETPNNAIFAVKIGLNGHLMGGPKLVRVMPPLITYTNGSGQPDGYSNPVADMEYRRFTSTTIFSPPILYCAERSVMSDLGSTQSPGFISHRGEARLIGIRLGASLPATFNIGLHVTTGNTTSSYANCCGGVALDLRRTLWTTGDALHEGWPDDLLSGLQRISAGGNAGALTPTTDSMLIDLDQNTLIDVQSPTDDVIQSGDVECSQGGL
jgi:sugar lactone lactonase YvrE